MKYYNKEDMYLLKQITLKEAKILDVGCGQGRYLIPLAECHDVLGIDINKDQVETMVLRGYKVIHVSDLHKVNIKFDYIIMSHIIEHLLPLEIIDFIDYYLHYLRCGGDLIIATPFLYNEFYDDYDHVRPYTPKAIQVLFSDYVQQQKKPRNRLVLKSVWIRKWPHVLSLLPGENKIIKNVKSYINNILVGLYYISFYQFSRSSGWVGVFRKC